MRTSTSLSQAQQVFLDAIRGSAALMVLLGHAAHYFLPGSRLADGSLQGMGVTLFFLISGFLISHSVLRRLGDSACDFRAYFIDRFCRIYCALLPALLFVVLVDALVHDAPSYAWRRDYTAETLLGNVLMLQDFPLFRVASHLGVADSSWLVGPFGSARPLWTISIEWWIYMVFGGLVLVLLQRHRRLGWLGAGALAIAAIEPLYHFLGGYAQALIVLWIAGSVASLAYLRLAA